MTKGGMGEGQVALSECTMTKGRESKDQRAKYGTKTGIMTRDDEGGVGALS